MNTKNHKIIKGCHVAFDSKPSKDLESAISEMIDVVREKLNPNENKIFHIFQNGELIGKDYQRENGEWSHRWFDSKTNSFERGSWTGKSEGDKMDTWTYVEVDEHGD